MIPLILYTLLIFVRNIVAGFDTVPARRPRGGRRRWATPAAAGSCRVELPLAMPLIVAGLRLATVSTIGLVTDHRRSSATGSAASGFFIFEGYRARFPTEILFGAVPSMMLAVAVDLALVAAPAPAHAVVAAGPTRRADARTSPPSIAGEAAA